MPQCSRCGSTVPDDTERTHHYCDNCSAVLDQVREQGVAVRSRHGNREFHQYPYEGPSYYADRGPENQVEALACAKLKMEETDSRGVFIYQKRGSRWLIDEYLDAHPSIAADVKKEMKSLRGRGDRGGYLRELIPI